jgi:hypothetical protein
MIGLAIDSTTAYFAKDVSPSPPGTPDTLDGGVLSCALTGCGGSPSELIPIDLVADDAGLLLPWQFAVDRTNLYWDMTRYQPNLAGPATGQVLACAKGGCGNSPTVLASGLRSPAGLTTDGISVYFTERGDTMGSNATDGRVSKCAVMQS